MSSPRILLVEDSPGDVKLTREAFEKHREVCDLDVVEDGEAALEYFKQTGEYRNSPRPDLVILDLDLPKMDGHDVLNEIKRNEGLKSIPVIILTMSEMKEDIERSYQLGANCCITKPIDFDEFEKLVDYIVEFWLKMSELPE